LRHELCATSGEKTASYWLQAAGRRGKPHTKKTSIHMANYHRLTVMLRAERKAASFWLQAAGRRGNPHTKKTGIHMANYHRLTVMLRAESELQAESTSQPIN